ncbi:hypothetical protein V1524DRAFT_459772 [Lipomyces starkeyi]
MSSPTELIDKVKQPPEFTDAQWDALAAYLDVQPPSAAMIRELQKTMVHFRKYRANREDIVTSALVTARPESRCRPCVMFGFGRSRNLLRCYAQHTRARWRRKLLNNVV